MFFGERERERKSNNFCEFFLKVFKIPLIKRIEFSYGQFPLKQWIEMHVIILIWNNIS